MDSGKQNLRLVGLGMLRGNGELRGAAMRGLTRHCREQKRRLVIASMRAWGFPSRTNKLHRL